MNEVFVRNVHGLVPTGQKAIGVRCYLIKSDLQQFPHFYESNTKLTK